MKQILCIMFVCFSMLAHGKTEGIEFKVISIDQAKEIAKKAKKSIFIDFYTQWCGPCKTMSQNVFKNDIVGDYVNENFVSLKIDAESENGRLLAKKFSVRGYPTMVILNSNGEELSRVVGGLSVESFLSSLRMSIDEKWSESSVKQRYERGERSSELIKEYALRLMRSGDEKSGYAVIDDYFEGLSKKKRLVEENFFIYDMFTLGINEQRGEYLLAHCDEIKKNEMKRKVSQLLLRWLRVEMIPHFIWNGDKNTDVKEYEELLVKLSKIDQADTIENFSYLKDLVKVKQKNNCLDYLKRCRDLFPNLSKNDRFVILNSFYNLDKESKECINVATQLIRSELSGMNPTLQKVMEGVAYRLEGKEAFRFSAQLNGVDKGEAIVLGRFRGEAIQDTISFTGGRLKTTLWGRDTMKISFRIISDEVAATTARGVKYYPYFSIMMVPRDMAFIEVDIEKGKRSMMHFVSGSEIVDQFIKYQTEFITEEQLKYKQLIIDNIIAGGDIRVYKKELDDYLKGILINAREYVKAFPETYLTSTILYEHYSRFDENYMDSIALNFPKDVKQSLFGSALLEKLKRSRPYRIGTDAPMFSKVDQNGESVRLSDFMGKYVLLDFWGSWCGPCRASHPHLVEMHKKYGKKVVFINVGVEMSRDITECEQTWKNAIKEDKLVWTQILNNIGVKEYDLVRLYGVDSFPTKILIDPNGKIASKLIGANADIEPIFRDLFN